MDKTINAADLAALLGAHSSAKQSHVDESQAGKPIDSTPGIWDTNFYNETLQPNATDGVFRFPSDEVLSRAEHVAEAWEGFVGAQVKWNEVSCSCDMIDFRGLTITGIRTCLHPSWLIGCQ